MKIDIDKNCIDFMIVLVMVCITLQSTILSLIISNVFFLDIAQFVGIHE